MVAAALLAAVARHHVGGSVARPIVADGDVGVHVRLDRSVFDRARVGLFPGVDDRHVGGARVLFGVRRVGRRVLGHGGVGVFGRHDIGRHHDVDACFSVERSRVETILARVRGVTRRRVGSGIRAVHRRTAVGHHVVARRIGDRHP
jgi:hypothetical protein